MATDKLVLSPNYWETPGYAGPDSSSGMPTLNVGGQTYTAYQDDQGRYRVDIPSADERGVDFGNMPNYSAQTIGSWAALRQAIDGGKDTANYYGFNQPASVLDEADYWANPKAMEQISLAVQRGDAKAAEQAAADGGFDLGGALLTLGLSAVGGPLLAGALGGGMLGAAGAGALLGGGKALLTGGDPLKGALTGGVGGAVGGAFTGGGFGGGDSLVSDPSWGSSWAGSIDNPGALTAAADVGGNVDLLDWSGGFGNDTGALADGGAFGKEPLFGGSSDSGWTLDANGNAVQSGISGLPSDPLGPIGGSGSTSTYPWLDGTINTTPINVDGALSDPTSTLGKLASALKGVVSNPVGTLKAALSGDANALKQLAQIGVPAALLAGVLEGNNQSPLQGALTNAANSANSAAGAFAAMPALQQTPSQAAAIERAKANVGNYQPYIDQASTLNTDYSKGVGGVDLSKYINPYIAGAIDPAAEAVNRQAALMKQANDARAVSAGAFGGSRQGVVDAGLNKDTLTTIGNLYKTGYSDAFNKALATAGEDVNRLGTAGTNAGNLGKTVGALGDADVSSLTSAGALEQKPQQDALTKAGQNVGVYSSIIPGTTQAAAATKDPSKLSEIVGALGAYGTANKIGII